MAKTQRQELGEMTADRDRLLSILALISGVAGEEGLPDPAQDVGEFCRQLADIQDAMRRAKRQRDRVVRRMKTVIEMMGSLDLELGQEGMSSITRMGGN